MVCYVLGSISCMLSEGKFQPMETPFVPTELVVGVQSSLNSCVSLVVWRAEHTFHDVILWVLF